jgi:hypothetical protein
LEHREPSTQGSLLETAHPRSCKDPSSGDWSLASVIEEVLMADRTTSMTVTDRQLSVRQDRPIEPAFAGTHGDEAQF